MLIGLAPLSGVQALAQVAAPGQAQDPAAKREGGERLRVVGGLAGVNQYLLYEEPFWSVELSRLSGGRYGAEIVPYDRAGIRAQEMLSLVRSGVVPIGTLSLGALTTALPEIGAPDLAGLNPDVSSLRATVAAFRAQAVQLLRQRFGIEVLAIYAYPAQAIFCAKPFVDLRALAGRRVRTASVSQADFVEALGAKPVPTAFAEIVSNVRAGNIDCAITGTMSGNSIGLFEVTSHVHAMAINWGLTFFVANGAAWKSLPADLRALLARELPKLEQRIWDESERETGMGLACNAGSAACTNGRKGAMTVVTASRQDEALRRDIFGTVVLPRWLQRCGAQCAPMWNQTLGATSGIEARVR